MQATIKNFIILNIKLTFTWDNGIYWNDPNYIVTQDSNGLFLTNYDRFFSDFTGSIVFVPIRNCFGYVASEKIKLLKDI